MAIIKMIILGALLCSCSVMNTSGVTANKLGTKKGESCASYVLGFAAGGDSFVHTAARNGRIKKISTYHQAINGLYPLYYQICTTVSGS